MHIEITNDEEIRVTAAIRRFDDLPHVLEQMSESIGTGYGADYYRGVVASFLAAAVESEMSSASAQDPVVVTALRGGADLYAAFAIAAARLWVRATREAEDARIVSELLARQARRGQATH